MKWIATRRGWGRDRQRRPTGRRGKRGQEIGSIGNPDRDSHRAKPIDLTILMIAGFGEPEAIDHK